MTNCTQFIKEGPGGYLAHHQMHEKCIKRELDFSYRLLSAPAIIFPKKFQYVAFSAFQKSLFSVKETRVRSLFLSQNTGLTKLPSEPHIPYE